MLLIKNTTECILYGRCKQDNFTLVQFLRKLLGYFRNQVSNLVPLPRMKSATQDRYWPDRPYPKQALARPTIPKDRYWPDRRDFGHHWTDWPDIVQTIGQTEQTLGQTVAQTIGQTVVQTNDQTEHTLGQTIVQTVGQTIRQTIGQTEQILGQTIIQTHLNVYKHPIKFIIYSFHFFE